VRNLELGESGDVSVTAQYKNSAGRWVAAPRPQKATRWKARVYVRGHDGVRQEIVRFGRTRREAEASLEAAVASVFRGADAVINPTMPLLEAGEYWLKQIARPDSGLSGRTIADYSWTWQKYIDSRTSSLRASHSSKRMTPSACAASSSGWPRHTAPRRRRKPRAFFTA
jgi:hypothetical protein